MSLQDSSPFKIIRELIALSGQIQTHYNLSISSINFQQQAPTYLSQLSRGNISYWLKAIKTLFTYYFLETLNLKYMMDLLRLYSY